jgi:hypothetical protein
MAVGLGLGGEEIVGKGVQSRVAVFSASEAQPTISRQKAQIVTSPKDIPCFRIGVLIIPAARNNSQNPKLYLDRHLSLFLTRVLFSFRSSKKNAN